MLNLTTLSRLLNLKSFYASIYPLHLCSMQNLGKSQSLQQQWATVPRFSGHIWVVALGLVTALAPFPKAQALEDSPKTEQRTSAPEIKTEEQLPPVPLSNLELDLPPLEQSLIAVDPQSITGPSENTAGSPALEKPDHAETPQALDPLGTSSIVPTFPNAEQAWAEDLETSQDQNPSESFLSQISQTPAEPEEIEAAEREESPTLEESPDLEEPTDLEDPADSDETPDLEESTDSEESAEAKEYVYGKNGQGRWFIQTGIGIPYNPEESNVYGLAGAGITHFFASGHSISASLNGLAFSQQGSDSVGINLDVIARWHFLRQRTWSLFIDGGVGILNTTSRVPLIGGSRFNFTPQVGGGVSLQVTKKTRLLMGLRWHHISNANLFEPNDGQDAVFGWVGLDLPR
jgi:lipid A 3-O-deacylase